MPRLHHHHHSSPHVAEVSSTLEGTLVFTAAAGDRFETHLEGAFMSSTTLAGVYTSTGGTGRFSNAA